MSYSDDLESEIVLAAADANARCERELEKTREGSERLPEKIRDGSSEKRCNSKEQAGDYKRKRTENYDHINSGSSFYGSPNSETSSKKNATQQGYANVVANHYNQLEEKGLAERSKCRILHLRNFHNWIKSMLINEYLNKIKGAKYNEQIKVLDLGCGKGGDLLKWHKGNITHLISADIAEVSLEQCKQRYMDMKDRNRGRNIFTIEYIQGDCTRNRLREKYKDPSMKLNLVSCQFVFHYSFESLPQAENMLQNAAECLQPGGYFIGTMPDSNDIVARARRNQTKKFGNDLFEVTLDFNVDHPPLFGGKYNFQLDGVVDCPEFLVHFPTLVNLAKKFGLKLEKKEKFHKYFEQMKDEGRQLMSNMKCLETYPPPWGSNLIGTASDDYKHADDFITKDQSNGKIGTLSKSEWEASSLYLAFAFVKVKPSDWSKDGKPIYNNS